MRASERGSLTLYKVRNGKNAHAVLTRERKDP